MSDHMSETPRPHGGTGAVRAVGAARNVRADRIVEGGAAGARQNRSRATESARLRAARRAVSAQPLAAGQLSKPASALSTLRPAAPAAIHGATLCCVVVTAILSALLLGDGLGVNALIVAVPATLGACFAARTAGRRLRPWTALWALGGLGLLAVPALRDAAFGPSSWPSCQPSRWGHSPCTATAAGSGCSWGRWVCSAPLRTVWPGAGGACAPE